MQAGVVIDPFDLEKVVGEYGLSKEECTSLVPLAHKGILEGLVQEPDNMINYGERLGCLGVVAVVATQPVL